MRHITKLSIFIFLIALFSCSESLKFNLKHCLIVPFKKGRSVSLDGYKLRVLEKGTGNPTVIIEGGIACSIDHYANISKSISKFAKVISYDHAGIGYSTPSGNPRTLPNYVIELKQLLEERKIEPPYIFVGHSFGGHIIRYYTHLYPEEVVGLVFIDAPHEDWFDYFRDSPRTEAEIINFNKSFNPGQMTYEGTHLEEWENYELNCDYVRGKFIPSNIPVRLITSIQYNDWTEERGYRPNDMKIWAEMQSSLIDGVNDSKHIITDKSSHWLHMEEPELVVDAVKELVDKYISSPIY